MKYWTSLFVVSVLCCVFGTGCFGRIFGGPESPRPKEYQVEAAKEIATKNVAEIMKGQLGKQTGIQAVALAAITAMATADSNAKVEGLTNIVANTANEIRHANGSAKLLSTLSGNANKGISEMSAVEYLAYTESQKVIAASNREKLAKGVDLGMETLEKVGGAALGTTGVGGLIALGISVLRRGRDRNNKGSLLKAVGNVVNDFETKNPDGAKELKTMMAKATSSLPVDTKKELGV